MTTRNRYLNVEPYAQNRIRLKVGEGASDYINASPIVLGQRRYIATQGPKDTSVHHFYRMLASEVRSPAVVVMLTQTHEAGREKCFQYYPLSADESPLVLTSQEEDAHKEDATGEVVLVDAEEDVKTRSEIRRLRLRWKRDGGNAAEDKDIHHLLFSGWPDFLIPEGEDKDAMIELIRLSAHLNSPSSTTTLTNGHTPASSLHDFANSDQSNPRIVHCSAGVGRSGTFIALDYLQSLLYTGQLDHLPADNDPVADTVDLMRQQRMMMVQGEPQFNFIYEVLRELYLARLDAGGMANGQVIDNEGNTTAGANAKGAG